MKKRNGSKESLQEKWRGKLWSDKTAEGEWEKKQGKSRKNIKMGNTREVRDLEFGDTEPLGDNYAEIQLTGCFIYYDSYLASTHFTDTTSTGYATEREKWKDVNWSDLAKY